MHSNRYHELEFSDNILAVDYYRTNFAVADSVRQAKQNLFQTKATENTTKHLLTCCLPQRFATIFDDNSNNELQSEGEILGKSKSSPEEDYCVRKHVIDNHLMTLDGLTLIPNPNNIDASDIKCDVLFPVVSRSYQESRGKNDKLFANRRKGKRRENTLQGHSCSRGRIHR